MIPDTTPGDDEWVSWIDMETIRDPLNPWLIVGVAWCVLLAIVSFLVLAAA